MSANVTLVTPDIHTFYVNEVFDFDIKVDNISEPINAAQFDINYNPQNLEALDVDFSRSFANTYLQKEIDNETGYIRISGGLPNPGISQNQAIFATIFFKALTPGTSLIKTLPQSQVLANDGQGRNILKPSDGFKILILAETASGKIPTTLEALKQNHPVLCTTTNENRQIYDFTKATVSSSFSSSEKQRQYPKKSLLEKIIRFDEYILSVFGLK